jgi:cell division transport system ATP-binding protein
MAGPVALEAQDIHKSFGQVEVLKGVSVTAHQGDVIAMLGASGSGKSTILRLAYLEEMPTRGEVRVSGVSTKEIRSRSEIARLRRKLGIVFQDFRLLDDRTAEANVAFALEVIGTRRDQIAPRVQRVLSQVGLSSKMKAFPKELSGGEQQRVAIARALVNDPVAVIADEPTGNLDERATRGVFQLLRDINSSGTAVIMATHNLELVRSADYRVIELDKGRLVFDSAESAPPPSPATGSRAVGGRGRRDLT